MRRPREGEEHLQRFTKQSCTPTSHWRITGSVMRHAPSWAPYRQCGITITVMIDVMRHGLVRRACRAAVMTAVTAWCAAAQGNLQMGNLGDFRLESGAVIRDCQAGYRTFGKLNAQRSNAVLFPSWFTG